MEICRDECKRKGGGDLASIHSREENNFVADLIRQRLPGTPGNYRCNCEYWIWIGGFMNPALNYEPTWLDGTPWDFSNWKPGARSFQDQLLYNVQFFRY